MKWNLRTLIYILVLSVGIMDGLSSHYDDLSLFMEEPYESNTRFSDVGDDTDALDVKTALHAIVEDHTSPAHILYISVSHQPTLSAGARAPPQAS